jgi:CRP-like cAMP-binding protein
MASEHCCCNSLVLRSACEQYYLDVGTATAYLGNEAVNVFKPGQYFGEQAFIVTVAGIMDYMRQRGSSEPSALMRRSATVRAMENCRCLVLTVKDFVSIFEGDLESLGDAIRFSSPSPHIHLSGFLSRSMQTSSLCFLSRSTQTSSLCAAPFIPAPHRPPPRPPVRPSLSRVRACARLFTLP